MNPVVIVSNLVGAVLGVWGGFYVMGEITPDLPDPDTEPGLEAPAEIDVKGGDTTSLFRDFPLDVALNELEAQQAAGTSVMQLHILADGISADLLDNDHGFQPDDVPTQAIELMVSEIDSERPEQVTLDDVRQVDLVMTERGPYWYLSLDSTRADLPPPSTYTASLEGRPIRPGGPPDDLVVD
jgi:hypothetical protein